MQLCTGKSARQCADGSSTQAVCEATVGKALMVFFSAHDCNQACPPDAPSVTGVCTHVRYTAGMMNAVSGDKAQDKSQGELIGLLKAMGYSAEQVYKF